MNYQVTETGNVLIDGISIGRIYLEGCGHYVFSPDSHCVFSVEVLQKLAELVREKEATVTPELRGIIDTLRKALYDAECRVAENRAAARNAQSTALYGTGK